MASNINENVAFLNKVVTSGGAIKQKELVDTSSAGIL